MDTTVTEKATEREQIKRAEYVAKLRALADFVEARTDLPSPNDVVTGQASQYGAFEKQVATVEAAAAALGLGVRRYEHDGRARVDVTYRDVTGFNYTVYGSYDGPADERADGAS